MVGGDSLYIICSYDVDQKHCAKLMKVLRKYLFHIHESVFEGTLTPSQFDKVKTDINKVISKEDSVIFFYSYNDKQIYKSSLGKVNKNTNIII